ncbi:unnamed protein product [Adineta steineri]|uniref:SET domain-containing protein n=1 Tax=Adineta steineri TaxID=433720 RepID=A0A813W4J6_9BILA|nr:unnamed protein product [Adineta steineri]CAF1078049.1 unnamed protein product [Adineta steineri]
MTENKVNLAFKEQKGRCLITNQNVSQGDILLVSKPYAIVPSITKKNDICANCICISKHQTHPREMIVCRKSCHHVFYCSNKCEQQHWEKFHQYECSFLDKVCALQDNDYVINYALLVMRMLTQRLHDILNTSPTVSSEDVWTMLSHFDEFTKEKKNEFETVAKILTEYILVKLIPHLIKDSHEFIGSIQSFLPDHTDAKKVEINNSDQWLSQMIHLCLLFNDDTTIKVVKYLLNKVYIVICMEEVNSFFHRTFVYDGYSQPPHVYALGVYPFATFINHSCSPNVERFSAEEDGTKFHMGDIVFFATHLMKQGEELGLSYLKGQYDLYIKDQVNADEIINSQVNRKQRIKNEYFFDCECTRCLNESKGELDKSFMNFVKEFKCTNLKCQGWFIPSFEKQMYCEACKISR